MRVRDATLLGLGAGLLMSHSSFALLYELTIFTALLAVAAIIPRKKPITGPWGGFLAGWAAGLGSAAYDLESEGVFHELLLG